jgi:hypothetical protein
MDIAVKLNTRLGRDFERQLPHAHHTLAFTSSTPLIPPARLLAHSCVLPVPQNRIPDDDSLGQSQ